MNKRLVWLPNLFTSLTLVSGFYSMTLALEGFLSAAVNAIMVAMVFDFLDGWIARRTNTVTDFGKEYDSLCDMVAFGLAPAITVYELLTWDSVLAWLVPALYSLAVAARLARFNASSCTQAGFEGLPCTAGGPFIVLLCYFFYPHASPMVSGVLTITTLAIGILMNSTVPYRSLKKKQRFMTLKVLGPSAFILAAFLLKVPLSTLAVILLLYIISPLYLIRGFIRQRRQRRQLVEQNIG